MRMYQFGFLMLLPLVTALFLGPFLAEDVQGAVVVVEESMIGYTPIEPAHSDNFNVSVDPLFIDAEPVEDGVVLMWSLCTDEGCGVATPRTMTENGDGTWSTVFEPFPEKDLDGKPYIDILFYVKITYVPTGGGEEASVQTDAITVLFVETTPDDDDDVNPPDDDDDDDDDSPLGLEIVLAGMIVVAAIMIYKRRN